ncbi:MAG: MBL fold metallo-hydrolase [Thermoleophilia bacterium]
MSRTTEVAPGIHEVPTLLGGGIRCAHWLVLGERGALLVDTGIHGDVAEWVVPALAELGLGPEALVECVISHADLDHAGGTSELQALVPGCRIRAHRLEQPRVESWAVCRDERYGWADEHGLGLPAETIQWMEGAYGTPGPIAGDVADGDRIDLGGTTLVVVELPGHAPGLVGLWHAASRTLIAQDAIAGRGPDPANPEHVTPPQYGSVELQRRTIERIRGLDPAVLGSSHFAPMSGATLARFLDDAAAFVGELDAVVRGALGPAARTLRELHAAADAAKIGAFGRTNKLHRSRPRAHLVDLEARGEAVREQVDGRPAWREA